MSHRSLRNWISLAGLGFGVVALSACGAAGTAPASPAISPVTRVAVPAMTAVPVAVTPAPLDANGDHDGTPPQSVVPTAAPTVAPAPASGSQAGSGSPARMVQPPAPRSMPVMSSCIPGGNGGDHDGDNQGGPSDGDGCR